MRKKFLFALAALTLCAAPANAAFISIDDSNALTITITAGDFEGGFYLDGNLFTTGLGNSNSIVLADGGHSISGSWIDLGRADGQRVDTLFVLPGGVSNFVTSGLEFGATSNPTNAMATLNGSFGGYVDPTLYFFTALAVNQQNGQTVLGGIAFLSTSFTSEAAAIPEPATLVLLGSGLVAAVVARRRRA